MIEINNLTKFSVDKKFFTGIAKKVLKGENRERENISIAFVRPWQIRKLNKKYRRKDKPTDVLSFEKIPGFHDEHSEIVICPEVVKSNTKKSQLALKKELAIVLIHGILHVLGYDHEISRKEAKIMEKRQKQYFSKVNSIS